MSSMRQMQYIMKWTQGTISTSVGRLTCIHTFYRFLSVRHREIPCSYITNSEKSCCWGLMWRVINPQSIIMFFFFLWAYWHPLYLDFQACLPRNIRVYICSWIGRYNAQMSFFLINDDGTGICHGLLHLRFLIFWNVKGGQVWTDITDLYGPRYIYIIPTHAPMQ